MPAIGGMPSTRGINWVTSRRFAPASVSVSGDRAWFFRLLRPLGSTRCPLSRSPDRSGQPREVDSAAYDATCPRHLPVAIPASDVNTTSRTHNPFPEATCPTECHSSEQTEYPSALCDYRFVNDRISDWVYVSESSVPGPPIIRLARMALPSHTSLITWTPNP